MRSACRLAELMARHSIILWGSFKLSSGITSSVYVDLRKALSYPHLYLKLAADLTSSASTLLIDADAVAGVATAGIPWATMLAAWYGKPLGYVRAERKEHGTMSVVEGELDGKRVVLVDDVSTTGSSLARAAEALRNVGAEPVYAVVVIDRCQGAVEALERLGVRLYTVYTLKEILHCLAKTSSEAVEALRELEQGKCAPTARTA